MQLIKCTTKLRKEMGLKDSALFAGEEPSSGLGSWHANLLTIQRHKCVLFANDKTLFNFIAPNVRRSEIRDLHKLFLTYLHPVLAQEGFTPQQRDSIASEYAEIAYAKSNNKSVLGSMNDLAFHYEHRIMMSGSNHSPEMPKIISDLNRMPMGALQYAYPIEMLKQHVQAIDNT